MPVRGLRFWGMISAALHGAVLLLILPRASAAIARGTARATISFRRKCLGRGADRQELVFVSQSSTSSGAASAPDEDEHAGDLDAAPPHAHATTAAQSASSLTSAVTSPTSAHGARTPSAPAHSTTGRRPRTSQAPRSMASKAPVRPSSQDARLARGRMQQAQQLMREQAGSLQLSRSPPRDRGRLPRRRGPPAPVR